MAVPRRKLTLTAHSGVKLAGDRGGPENDCAGLSPEILSRLPAAPPRLVFSEYFRLQPGELIGNRSLVDLPGDFLVSGLFDH